ncbi:MAG: hypothetical protein CVV27_00535 [Candidatus Melainabacteria bacterium HGW-Melainabacteria-1]|nr:MAG: hypothetical protein CVV27_00535 [Candidatus Melainabacteria bacterium HGW-Melainabacteria-1]
MMSLRILSSVPLFALLTGLLVSCSGASQPVQTPRPSASSEAAKLLDALANQLDGLREQLAEARTQASAQPDQIPQPGATPTPRPSATPPLVHPCQRTPQDSDRDGLPDSCEQALAESFAPVVYHSSEESRFPTSVEAFLPQTILYFRDTDCDLNVRVLSAPTPEQLVAQTYPASCKSTVPVAADSTRSKDKQRSYYLADVAEEARAGSKDGKDWVTYVHAYPNNLNGATIQYWRFYAYEGKNHGGDWEAVHVVLDSQFKPVRLGLLGDSLSYVPWAEVSLEGSRPRVFVDPDIHTSRAKPDGISADGCKGIGGFFSCKLNPEKPETFVRHETWTGGQISWFSGESGTGGGLLNVGERSTPLNGQLFIRYAGLWGSPGRIGATSGEWGPAYNGIGMLSNGYLTAWATGMLNPRREEAYPLSVSP